jgi:type III pantothenate kinase
MKALLIDIGNSRIKARLIDTRTDHVVDFEPVRLDRLDRLSEHWQMPHAAGVVGEVVFISNVAGNEVEASVARWLRERVPAIRIVRVNAEPATAGVTNGYRDATRLGADRWMALVGAHTLMPARSLLVCSFGTATTLDLLLHDHETGGATFVGGVILPGVEAMRAGLLARTAGLGVEPGSVVDFADSTEDAITSGVMLAQTGALHEAWRRARLRTTGPLECVVAGGTSPSIVAAFDRTDIPIHHAPDLVMRGLAVVAHRWEGASRDERLLSSGDA